VRSRRIAGVVVKVAELCNLNCTYCYMYNHVDQSFRHRPKVMTRDCFETLLRRLDEYVCDHGYEYIDLAFHGGEPMLLNVDDFRAMGHMARCRFENRLQLRLSVQTNATLVTDEWVRALRDYRVQVGVSLDGPRSFHDTLRAGKNGNGSYDKVLDGLSRLRAGGVWPSVLCVINPEANGLQVYEHFRELDFAAMDFLIPEVSHDYRHTISLHDSHTPIADYLIPIFDEWIAEDDPNVYIRLFESIIRLLLGSTSYTQSIGGGPKNYIVVETDGSIHGDDCLKVCDEGLSDTGLNIFTNSINELFTCNNVASLGVLGSLPPAKECATCPELGVCGGGSIPNRYSSARGFDNPSVWCDDLKILIAHIRKTAWGAVGAPLH
jgi:uncharacterized protein